MPWHPLLALTPRPHLRDGTSMPRGLPNRGNTVTKRGPYNAEVQQRPLTCASKHNQRHTRQLAGTTTKRPALPLVRDQEAVPAACPIGRSTPGTHGHSRTARYTGSPAYRQADPLRKPTS
jgi:hypothetical protein